MMSSVTKEPDSDDGSAVVDSASSAGPSHSGTTAGFYERFRSMKNAETPKPSFLQDSKVTLDYAPDDAPKEDAPSVPPPPSVLPTFNSLKRKRRVEYVEKPSFKISAFVAPPLPKFGTPLNTGTFDFRTNKSSFYSGQTTFGGSSSFRSESVKRVKLSPVSQRARHTNQVRVTAKPVNESSRTLTSKTAENILKTLSKISSPIAASQSRSSTNNFTSNFPSFSQRLRDRSKRHIPLYQPPIKRLNQIKSIEVSNPKSAKTNEAVQSPSSASTSEEIVPKIDLETTKEGAKKVEDTKTDSHLSSKSGLKMKRARTTAHYSSGDKDEQLVNTMPEIVAPKPLIITSLPTFDMTVKPAVPLFTPVSVPAVSSKGEVFLSFKFSTPTVCAAKGVDPDSIDAKFSFVSPIHMNDNAETKKTAEENIANDDEIKSATPPPSSDTCIESATSGGESEKSSENKIETTTSAEIEGENKEIPSKTYALLKDSNANIPFSLKFAKPAGSWDCPTCMVVNNAESLKCPACTEPKPGSQKENELEKPTFSFGLSTSNAVKFSNDAVKSTFSFGQSTIPIKSSSEAVKSTFSFGQSSIPMNSSSEAVKTTFPFCQSTYAAMNPSSEVKSTISFGQSTTIAEKSSSAAVKSTFSFGQPSGIAKVSPDVSFSTTAFSQEGFRFSKPTEKTQNAVTVSPPKLKIKQPPPGSWSCPVCMITNDADCLKCAACTETKPGEKESTAMFSFGKPTDSTTKSDVPALSNLDTPATESKVGENISAEASSVIPSATSSVIPPATSGVTLATPFANFKPAAEGSWDCPTCMIVNKPDCMKCVACTEPKPGADKGADGEPCISFGQPAGGQSGFKFGMPASSSGFSFGISTNSTTASTGFTFGKSVKEESSSTLSSGKPTVAESTAANSNPFSKLKPAEGSWDCPTCMIVNKPDCLKCAACTEPKPGAKAAESVPSIFTNKLTEGGSTSFSFGTTQNLGSAFSFGVSSKQPDVNSTAIPSVGFSFGKVSNVDSDSKSKDDGLPSSELPGKAAEGKAEPAIAVVKPNESAGFSFAVSKPSSEFPSSNVVTISSSDSVKPAVSSSDFCGKSSAAVNPPFKFGATGDQPVLFSFGTGNQLPTKCVDAISEPKSDHKNMNGPIMEEKAPTAFSFGTGNKDADSKPMPVFSVLNSGSESKAPPSGFSFGSASSGFNFGAGKDTAMTTSETKGGSGFNFGSSTSGFGFGSKVGESKSTPGSFWTKPAAESTANLNGPSNAFASSTSFKFGDTSSTPSFNAPQSTANFNGIANAVTSNTPFNFGSSSAVPSFLTNSNDKQPEPPAKFNFNSAAKQAPSFLSSSVPTPFNANATPFNPNAGGTFNFGASNNNIFNASNNRSDTSKVNIFAAPPPSTNLFSIGSSNAENTGGGERRKMRTAHRRLNRK